ncbi:hypothetical protein F3Y22_tig00111509pilonHSYRG00001 [Hibiscus syriacus]|uniref:Uncharacterized protein n=1 Tax=Hibiscus syriacus TaxID=106335 RepID=A0A6A2XNR2_HIBSY|nr:hypothetical protein F3Y22_tig00111509pilonHSYRG00001 [Hibiscus syriacus]
MATSSKPSLESDSGSHHSISIQSASPSDSGFGTLNSASVWQDVNWNLSKNNVSCDKKGCGEPKVDRELAFELGSKLPNLTINKIGIEKPDEVNGERKKSVASNEDEFELLKGVYSWMRRDLEKLENENREMKQCIEDVRHEISASRESEGLGRGPPRLGRRIRTTWSSGGAREVLVKTIVEEKRRRM